MNAQEIQEEVARLGGADHIVRGTAGAGSIRAFAATTRQTVQFARDAHHTSPVVTAALGRLLTAGTMMGSMLKDEGELLSLIVHGDGPIGSLTVTANAKAEVKGFAANPDVWLPLREADGKLDVGKAVGHGSLTVVQDVPWGEPYSSEIALVSGEIGDDIAAYYVESEQVATSVGLGVLVDTDLSVRQAGGFIIQLLPDATEDAITRLENNLAGITSVTDLLEQGLAPASILARALDGLGFEALEVLPCGFRCNCSRERTERVIAALGTKEVEGLIADNEPIDLVCHFCSKTYTFTPDELRAILADMQPDGKPQAGDDEGGTR